MPTVLLVDDDGDCRMIYRSLFSRHGYRVLEAERGEEAVRIAFAERPDLIITDLMMPVVDGWTATRALKNDRRTRGIPVIAVSGYTAPEAVERAHRAGCDVVLSKPCHPGRLIDEARRLLESNRAPNLN